MMKYVISPDGEVAMVDDRSGVEHRTLYGEMFTGTPVSGGFAGWDGESVSVKGRSVSLGVASRPEDAEIIEKAFADNRFYADGGYFTYGGIACTVRDSLFDPQETSPDEVFYELYMMRYV